MATQQTQFPLLTQRHVHHSSVWTLRGYSVPTLCLACATERLEDRADLSLHHRRVLGELQGLLTAKDSSLVRMLSSDRRVLDHLSTTVFGLLVTQDGTTAQLAMEVLSAISGQFSATDLPRKLMQKTIQTVMATQRCSDGLPYLTFLGRMLYSLPPLCTEMTNSFGGFLEYLLRGLAYPDEDVKSAVVYMLAQLSMKTPQDSLPASLVQAVCGLISSNLASAKSHTLTLNLLGLVKGMLKSSVYAQCL
ncbi:Meiosis inhibitor protein 1, partial [Geodia barretti]